MTLTRKRRLLISFLALLLALALPLTGCSLGGQSREADKLISQANGHVDKGNVLDKEVAALFKQMGGAFAKLGSENTARAAASVKKIESLDAQARQKLGKLNEEAKASALAIAKARELNVSEDMKQWLAMELEANGAWQKSTKVQAQLSLMFVKVARATYAMMAETKSNVAAIQDSGSTISISKAQKDLAASQKKLDKILKELGSTSTLVTEASANYEQLKSKANAFFKEKSLGKPESGS